MTTRQKLRLQLPQKKQKILKYYYKKLTKIKYSHRANTYNHCAQKPKLLARSALPLVDPPLDRNERHFVVLENKIHRCSRLWRRCRIATVRSGLRPSSRYWTASLRRLRRRRCHPRRASVRCRSVRRCTASSRPRRPRRRRRWPGSRRRSTPGRERGPHGRPSHSRGAGDRRRGARSLIAGRRSLFTAAREP